MADTYPFPSKRMMESKKSQNKEYHMAWAKAINSLYTNNKSGISALDRDKMALMRRYGSGTQPSSLYADYASSNNGLINSSGIDEDGNQITNTKSARNGFNHINDSNVSLMPRIKNRVKGYVYGVDYDIVIDTIDDNSGAEKEDKKNAMRVQMEHGKFIAEFKKNAGLPIDQPAYVPQSPQELELYASINGFKLNSAIAMEKLVKHTFEISNWDNVIRDLLLDDAMDLGYMACRVYFDAEDYKFKVKYCDPEMMVLPYNKYHDYSEMTWVGVYEQMTITDLRMELPDVKEEDLMALAKNSCGKLGNPQSTLWDSYKGQSPDGAYGYDDFLVMVLHVEWIDEEFYSKVNYTSKNGRKSRYIVESPEERKALKEKNKPNTQIVDYNKRKLRSCSWIVDSDLVFDWGMANFQDRPTKNKVVPSYRVVRLNDKPLTELLYPVMDDIKIAWMKFQDARAMAIKAGYGLDFSMLQNIDDGDKKYSILDILKMWRESGILIFQGSLDGKYEGGATKPVTDIPGTAGVMIQESVALWNFALQKLQDVTGLSPTALGAMSGGTAAEAQLSTSATVDILRPVITKMLSIKEMCSASTIRKIQLGIRFNDDISKSYEGVVGKNDMKILKDAEKSQVQYGQTFEAKPDEEYKRSIIEAANISLQQRRDGKPGIDLSTWTYIMERIQGGGNLKELRLVIAYQETKAKEMLDQQNQNNIKLQGQQNKELEQIKAQAAASMKQMEAEDAKMQFTRDIIKEYYKANPSAAEPFIAMATGQIPQSVSQGQQAPQNTPNGQGGGNMPPQEKVPQMV